MSALPPKADICSAAIRDLLEQVLTYLCQQVARAVEQFGRELYRRYMSQKMPNIDVDQKPRGAADRPGHYRAWELTPVKRGSPTVALTADI
jgi:hypothetical protein